jgi:solute carrier family 45 protein 1/2/4
MGGWFGDIYNEVHNTTQLYNKTKIENLKNPNLLSSHKYGTTLTVLGVLLLDLDCDACQSPSRAYLLDVTNPSQHSLGLTTFTFMAGLGGCLGYFLGGIPWEHTFLSKVLGDHIHVLFTLVWIIYIICMMLTLTASKEPTGIRNSTQNLIRSASRQFLVSSASVYDDEENSSNNDVKISYLDYIRSIIYMPSSLRWLCLTNFFCWMALVSYSLFFTDFVGQAVFGKDKSIKFIFNFYFSFRWKS